MQSVVISEVHVNPEASKGMGKRVVSASILRKAHNPDVARVIDAQYADSQSHSCKCHMSFTSACFAVNIIICCFDFVSSVLKIAPLGPPGSVINKCWTLLSNM